MCAPGRKQIERERHARQEICRQPLRVNERADLAIGSLAPGDMGDLGGEEIAASLARGMRDAAAEIAALAVLVDVAADREVPVLAPERLEQTRGRPEPRIERLVNAVFFEDVGRDKRQLVNGLSVFRGHASRSNGHEANSRGVGRNLHHAVGRTGLLPPQRPRSANRT